MGTNSHIAKLKAQLNQAIIQREHWKQLAENRNSIVVTEVCPDSRSVEEYIIDADSVRASWRLIRGYREQIAVLEAANAADKALIAELTEALKSAREMVADWGAYASEYFREKHGLDRDIAELDAALAQQGKENE